MNDKKLSNYYSEKELAHLTFYHDLMNHLHQIQLFNSLGQEGKDSSKQRVIDQECWEIIRLLKSEKQNRAKPAMGPNSARKNFNSAEGIYDFTTSYFSSRGIKLNIKDCDQLKFYELNVLPGYENFLGNVFQNIQRHGELGASLEIRQKISGGYLLIAFENKTESSCGQINEGIGLSSMRSFAKSVKGKVRFEQKGRSFCVRLFIPIRERCPVLGEMAA